jgi:hypothetical protein
LGFSLIHWLQNSISHKVFGIYSEESLAGEIAKDLVGNILALVRGQESQGLGLPSFIRVLTDSFCFENFTHFNRFYFALFLFSVIALAVGLAVKIFRLLRKKIETRSDAQIAMIVKYLILSGLFATYFLAYMTNLDLNPKLENCIMDYHQLIFIHPLMILLISAGLTDPIFNYRLMRPVQIAMVALFIVCGLVACEEVITIKAERYNLTCINYFILTSANMEAVEKNYNEEQFCPMVEKYSQSYDPTYQEEICSKIRLLSNCQCPQTGQGNGEDWRLEAADRRQQHPGSLQTGQK